MTTRETLTAEQRAAYKTRADRVQEILVKIEKLERWRNRSLRVELGDGQSVETVYSELSKSVWQIGIDTLIAQLEQELADLDKPNVVRFATPPRADCPICGKICMGHNKPVAYPPGFDPYRVISLNSGQVTAKQMEPDQYAKYPVVSGPPDDPTERMSGVLTVSRNRAQPTLPIPNTTDDCGCISCDMEQRLRMLGEESHAE